MRAVLVAAEKSALCDLPRKGGKALRCDLHFGTLKPAPGDPKAFSGVSIPDCLVLRRKGRLAFVVPRTSGGKRPLISPDIVSALLDQVERQPVASRIGAGQNEKFAELVGPVLEPVKVDIATEKAS